MWYPPKARLQELKKKHEAEIAFLADKLKETREKLGAMSAAWWAPVLPSNWHLPKVVDQFPRNCGPSSGQPWVAGLGVKIW